jgi:hypothetical protein
MGAVGAWAWAARGMASSNNQRKEREMIVIGDYVGGKGYGEWGRYSLALGLESRRKPAP